MHLIRKRKSKPIRGSRKIRLRELPWLTYLKCLTVVIIAGILAYQFFSLRFHTQRLNSSLSLNQELSSKVAVLTSNLEEEQTAMDNYLAEQSSSLSTLNEKIDSLSAALQKTQQDNKDLNDQLTSVKSQNTVLRQKLETILGQSSRSGTALEPSPVGRSGLTVADLKKLTRGTGLAGIEEALLQIETAYNCNALYALAVAKLETGCGSSELCRNHNNLFGMRGSRDWNTYSTKSASVLAFGKLMKTNYFSKGYVTLRRIGPRYAEGSTSWANVAKTYMLTDMRRLI